MVAIDIVAAEQLAASLSVLGNVDHAGAHYCRDRKGNCLPTIVIPGYAHTHTFLSSLHDRSSISCASLLVYHYVRPILHSAAVSLVITIKQQ